MSDNATGPRTVGDYLAILQAKKTQLCADIDAAEKGLRGGGRPRGFQAEGRTDEETAWRGAAWVQGRVDADFLLPGLRWLHQDLSRLGVVNLPAWTCEPRDETAALDLLNRMILACQRTDSTATPPAPQHPSLTDEDRYILLILDAHGNKALTFSRIEKESIRMNEEDRTIMRRLNDSIIRQRVQILLSHGLVERPAGTSKKGIAITEAGRKALHFAHANPTETERKK